MTLPPLQCKGAVAGSAPLFYHDPLKPPRQDKINFRNYRQRNRFRIL